MSFALGATGHGGFDSTAKGSERAKIFRQVARRALADVADAKRVEEAIERDRAASVDRGEQLFNGPLAVTLAGLQRFIERRVSRLECENISRLPDQALGEKQLDLFGTEAVDIECIAGDEVLKALLGLGRTDEAAGAAAHNISFPFIVEFADGIAATGGTGVGKDERFGAGWSFFEHGAEHLRDDVAGALDSNQVADADILPGNLIFVMERGVGHDDAANRDRLKLRDGC